MSNAVSENGDGSGNTVIFSESERVVERNDAVTDELIRVGEISFDVMKKCIEQFEARGIPRPEIINIIQATTTHPEIRKIWLDFLDARDPIQVMLESDSPITALADLDYMLRKIPKDDDVKYRAAIDHLVRRALGTFSPGIIMHHFKVDNRHSKSVRESVIKLDSVESQPEVVVEIER